MLLDSATLWMAIGTAAVVIGALQVLQYVLYRDEIAMLLWGIAKLTGAIGAVLLGLRGQIPAPVSVTVGCMLITLAVSSNAAGTVRFNGNPVSWTAICAPPIVMTAGFLAVPNIDTNIQAQTIINGVCVIGPLSWSAIRAHRANAQVLLRWRRGLAIVQWIWVATMVLRMVAAVRDPAATDPTGQSVAQTVTALYLLSLVVTLGVVEMLSSRERVDRQLAELALRDMATGTYNRAGLARHVAGLAERRASVAVVLMDIDDFKAVNDRFGHPIGDEVLAGFVRIATAELRDTDLLARYGGDEFCAVLPGTDLPAATVIAERIRSTFAEGQVCPGDDTRCSVSMGMSSISLDGPASFDTVVRVADAALYSAKTAGADRVVAATCSPGGDDLPGGGGTPEPVRRRWR